MDWYKSKWLAIENVKLIVDDDIVNAEDIVVSFVGIREEEQEKTEEKIELN